VERVCAEDVGAALARDEPTLIVSSARVLRADQAPGLPRVLLHTGDGDDEQVIAAPGQRVLDIRTDAGQMLDVLELLEHLGGPAAGKVVIVDDDPVVRALLRSLVARDGLAVETFANARSCLTGLETTDPLILVLDVDLAKTSGVALARKVRLVPAWADVPILMVTSHADATTRAEAFAAGADDYMVKPIVPAEFQQRLTRLVEARRRGRVAGGVHPATGLPLRARTLREVEARLRDLSEGSASVVIVRPAVVPADARAEDAWRLEVVRIARAIRAADGIAGFVDELGLGGMLPLRAPDVRRRLASLVEDAPVHAPAWHAGIASHDPGSAAPRTGALWDEAEAACLGARDRAAPARVWNASDFDVAPDVIVVETDDALADLIVFALEARGLTQRRFGTGPAALDALLLMRPHGRTPIVLLEVDLPGLNGHSLHERLRLDRPGIFDVVFVSTHASEAEQLRALQDGALDYITKPVSLRVLVAKLASWRSRHLSA
jgi:DNA-binding response OmpR family regulator